MGIIPNYTRRKGEMLRNGRPFHLSEWGIHTEYENSIDISEQLLKITEKLKDKVSVINEICSQYRITCSFVVVINIEQGIKPTIGFESDFIKFACSINADVGIDLYICS